MNDVLNDLKTSELPYLCKAFAKFLYEQNKNEDSVVLLAGAFVSYQLSKGEVFLDLNEFFKAKTQFNEIEIGSLKTYFAKDWKIYFSTSKVITTGEGNSPLVWDKEHNRLYLRRYWECQKTVYEEIEKRLKYRKELPVEIEEQLNQLFPETEIKPDWQKIACAVALRSNFAIITGGPGTGKTTTVTKLLALSILLSRIDIAKGNNFKPEILLAAPTGKAANRVSESINNALNTLGEVIPDEIKELIPKKAKTIHRLLGSRPKTRLYKYNKTNPLIADIMIIDEASMISLEMMAALLEALPEKTQLILLGDKDQLSSVEPGFVFGDLCKGAENSLYNQETLNWISQYTNEKIEANTANFSEINQQTVMLKYSYRFPPESGIGQLAYYVNSSSGDKLFDTDSIFENHINDLNEITSFKQLEAIVKGENANRASYANYISEIKNRDKYSNSDEWAEKVLKAFDEFRILCAIHESDLGTEALNNKVQAWLFPNEERTWFEGRPVMITKNDYSLGLMNGDIGIALKVRIKNPDGSEGETLKVAFVGNDEKSGKIRWFSTSRISEAQTAFVLTVHKSQGSEFNHTLFVLPSSEVKVLTKELYYTAITRARKNFTLFNLKTSQGETVENNNLTNENVADSNDAWVDELIAWADENEISERRFPRDKEAILNLTELNLRNNKLSILPESFGNLMNLTSLDLYSNQLSTFPESFANLTNLTDLNLSYNQLSTLPESITKLTNLTSLNLSSNQLSTIPESIGNLTNLTTLNLYRNQLSDLPKLIGMLTELTNLDLSDNQFKNLPEWIWHLKNLTELFLSYNQFSYLPKWMGDLFKLTSLHLNNNNFNCIPECISDLWNLTELNLGNNKLSNNSFSEIYRIWNMGNLTSLNLSSNGIQELSESIGYLTKLTDLDLSYNHQLCRLPESIGNLTNLTVLDLVNVRLEYLPESIGNLTNLEELYLSGNIFRKKSDLPKSVQNLIDKNDLECFEDNDEDEDEDEDDD